MSSTNTAGSTRPTSCSPHSSLHVPLPLHPFLLLESFSFDSSATPMDVTPDGHSGVGSGPGASATYAILPSRSLQLMPPLVPSTHNAPCVFAGTKISDASAPPSQISTHKSVAPRSPSSLPLRITIRLAPDGDTLDAMTPRSSVPKLGWRNAVDAPFVPSLSTVIVATLRRALFATRSRCDVVTRRVSRASSCGSLCNCAPAAKGKDANDSNSEVSASTAAASTSMSDVDDAIGTVLLFCRVGLQRMSRLGTLRAAEGARGARGACRRRSGKPRERVNVGLEATGATEADAIGPKRPSKCR